MSHHGNKTISDEMQAMIAAGEILTLDFFRNPTNQRNYVDRDFAQGTPLNWRDDVTGKLGEAVMAYLNQEPSPEQMQAVIEYLKYHIHAPCWLESPPFGEVDEEMADSIRSLREQALTLESVEDINAYIHAALAVGLDPL